VSALEIREATAADLAAAVALLRTQLAEHAIALDPAVLARTVRGIDRNRDFGRVLVARDGDRVVGVALLSFLWTLEHGGASAWLDELYVEPAARARGVGRALAEAAIAAAEAADCIALDLEVEPGHDAAVRLYERLGFRRHERARWMRPLARARAADAASLATPYSRDQRPFASLDHLSLGVTDLARSKAFYDAALAPLGLVAHVQIPGEVAYGPPEESPVQGFAFYIGFEDPSAKRAVSPSAGFHLAFRAPNREAVRRFHAAGLAHGGRDLGAPGLRPRYHADYYGAFLADPDGHHVEAVCHAPERSMSTASPTPSR
jgi:ribosomal protein S18 acetylase RimI-like enzyme/catechol 2,3-dioxygenase-like lactoylglutathione lyase family enzyme